MTPIRRGTAARLGLRPPDPAAARPRLLLQFNKPITTEQEAEFRRRFEEAVRSHTTTLILEQR